MTNESEVTQADRELAWVYRRWRNRKVDRDAWLNGDHDDDDEIQDFARHREASTAELREALDKIALLSSNHGGWLENDPAKLVFDINAVANEALDSTRRQR